MGKNNLICDHVWRVFNGQDTWERIQVAQLFLQVRDSFCFCLQILIRRLLNHAVQATPVEPCLMNRDTRDFPFILTFCLCQFKYI